MNGILQSGLSLIVGTKSVGKTWLALYLALKTVAGQNIFGTYKTQQGSVLYITPESQKSLVASQLQQLTQTMNLQGEGFLKNLHFAFQDTSTILTLEEMLEQLMNLTQDHRLIIVDSYLVRVQRRLRKQERERLAKLVISLNEKAKSDGATVLFVLPHCGETETILSAFGTSRWELTRIRTGNRRMLEVTGKDVRVLRAFAMKDLTLGLKSLEPEPF